ncbi:DUF5105 domain-containing protein [Vagococcus hydrophili]|uniref:DUF5105 domain-containing protein n=1 Tax=Vagococcus hydrophili TaxID=2714947 RepID=A0A6G8AT01_9ENTE|nr:DUF5105 domain-containing protein [Vagococcus hydrophili]QIL48099.1 DUF5105 domain-containing protein [Vagococcus hydrophili]
MKIRKLSLVVVVYSFIILLSACGSKRPEPKEAVNVFMNAEVYGKDKDKYGEYFGMEPVDTEASLIYSVKEGLKPDVNGLSDAEVKKIANELKKVIEKETRFEVIEVKDKKDTATAYVDVYGLDLTGLDPKIDKVMNEEMQQYFKEKGVNVASLEEIEKLEDESELEKIEKIVKEPDFMTTMTERTLLKIIPELKQTKKEQTVEIGLKVNEKNKNQWEVIGVDPKVLEIYEKLMYEKE